MGRTTVESVNQKSGRISEDVLHSVHQIVHLARSDFHRQLRGKPYDLTHQEAHLLRFFSLNPGATLSDLVEALGRDKGQLARLVRSLREKGILSRQKDAGDRRNVRLSVTPRGRAIHQSLHEEFLRLSELAVKGLTTAQRKELIAILGRIQENLEQISNETSASDTNSQTTVR